MAYLNAVKVRAKKLYLTGLGLHSIMGIMHSDDNCATLNEKTLQRWKNDYRWEEAKQRVLNLALVDTEEQARLAIGEAVDKIDDVLALMFKRLKDPKLKCATFENTAGVFKNILVKKLEMIGAMEKVRPKVKASAERRTVRFEGSYEESIETISAEQE